MKKSKAKKVLKRAKNELTAQIFQIYFEEVANARITLDDGSVNSDYTYYSGMIDGFTFALDLISKDVVPLLPTKEDIQTITIYPFEFSSEDDNDGTLFTTPENIEEEVLL